MATKVHIDKHKDAGCIVRLSLSDWEMLTRASATLGYRSRNEYIRHRLLAAAKKDLRNA